MEVRVTIHKAGMRIGYVSSLKEAECFLRTAQGYIINPPLLLFLPVLSSGPSTSRD